MLSLQEKCIKEVKCDQEENIMLSNLEKLEWRRISVRFLRTIGKVNLTSSFFNIGIDAHNNLPVIRRWLNYPGYDVVAHVCKIVHDNGMF